MNKFENLKAKFGSVEFEGKEYALGEIPRKDGAYTATEAVADAIDEKGVTYQLSWKLNKEMEAAFEEAEKCNDNQCILECDWGSPVSIKGLQS